MKNLFISFFVFCFIPCFSQWGIKAGLNLSSYTGGAYPYTGVKHTIASPTGGVYKKIWFGKIFIQPELDFLMMGAENPVEQPERFFTYHVHLPVVVGVAVGKFSFQGGMYINKMLRAGNYTWFGVNTFDWDTNGWYYLDHVNYGGTVGAGYDFIGMEIQISYIHDFNKTQNIAWDYNVKKLGYNQALAIVAYIPLKLHSK